VYESTVIHVFVVWMVSGVFFSGAVLIGAKFLPLIIVVEIVTSCEDEYKFPQASRDPFFHRPVSDVNAPAVLWIVTADV